MRFFFSIVFILFISQIAETQPVDHWEMLIDAGDAWRYFTNGEPDQQWNQLDYNDNSGQHGPGGIGYDDGDDVSVISPTISLYMRRHFFIEDLSIIGDLIFCIDYDDAFVAFINGIEIARANIGTPGNPPGHPDFADNPHEAQMYQGGQPEYFAITDQPLESLLVNGDNVLAIQQIGPGWWWPGFFADSPTDSLLLMLYKRVRWHLHPDHISLFSQKDSSVQAYTLLNSVNKCLNCLTCGIYNFECNKSRVRHMVFNDSVRVERIWIIGSQEQS
ncbi:hypothetical protein JXA70_11265 [candidate division KSB1 bacterium]|nr:hypothetical protein [candidate division KSB1 bacterium]